MKETKEPARVGDKQDADEIVAALNRIVQILEPLNNYQRVRVIKAVAILFDLKVEL